MNPDLGKNRTYQRLQWKCRRGTRELDLILMRYLENHYRTASVAEQDAFCALVERTDPELESLLLARDTALKPIDQHLLSMLCGAGA